MAIVQPELASWLLNTEGAKGQYWNGNNLIQMQDECDAQLVPYSADQVCVHATGIPRYATAPGGTWLGHGDGFWKAVRVVR